MEELELKASELVETMSVEQKLIVSNNYLLCSEGKCTLNSGETVKMDKVNSFITNPASYEMSLLTRTLSISDFFIAYVVAVLGIADVDSIKRYLNYLHKKFPKKLVPYTISVDVLEKRLQTLCREGFVRKLYVDRTSYKLKFYTFAEPATEVLKRVLDLNTLRVDGLAAVDGPCRLGRNLFSSIATTAIVTNTPMEVLNVRTNFQLHDKTLKTRFTAYAGILLDDAQKRKVALTIEPVIYECDEIVKTTQELENDIKERMRALSVKISNSLKSEENNDGNNDTTEEKIVFVVSTGKDMARVVKTVLEVSTTLAENSYFTTERLLSAHDGLLDRCFYEIKFVETDDGGVKPDVVLAKNERLFGNNSSKPVPAVVKATIALGLVN